MSDFHTNEFASHEAYVVLIQDKSLTCPAYLAQVDGLFPRYNAFNHKQTLFISERQARAAIKSFIGSDTENLPEIGKKPTPKWRFQILKVAPSVGGWEYSSQERADVH